MEYNQITEIIFASLVVLLVIFLIVAVVWVTIDDTNLESDKCIKICNLKGFDFYDLPIQHNKCECLNKQGDIMVVSR
jgi:hypothetical protein